MARKKTLSIGTSNFKKLISSNAYFVDKTLFIKEIIDSSYEVILVPRPRRFGKSFNLSMLRYYFDVAEKDTQQLFESYKIWQQDEFYTSKQGKYPVIFVSLKAAKATNYKDALVFFKTILTNLYEHYRYLLDKEILSPEEKNTFKSILEGKGDLSDYVFSLQKLSKYLFKYYGQKVLILMDEYDAPIHTGFTYGYYEDIITLMKSLMGNTFKDNDYLYKGIITGILRIAKESIFLDLNNPGIFTLLSHSFADKFGFTEQEVHEMLQYFDLATDFNKVKEWYDGYLMGNVNHIYNPWSVINYIARHTEGFKPYWVNTSSDNLIKSRIIEKDAHYVRSQIEKIIQGRSIEAVVDENIVFSDFNESREILWSLLVFCGYLGIVEEVGWETYELKIPNYEIKTLFKKIILEWLDRELHIRHNTLKAMAKSLTQNKIKEFERYFKKIMGDTFSYFDTNTEPERVYQAYVLGLLGIMGDDYIIKSNRESGEGRYDILLLPKKQQDYGIIIEIKQLDKDASQKSIKTELSKALKQITKNKYYKELIAHQIQNRIEMAMVFVGKEVHLKVN